MSGLSFTIYGKIEDDIQEQISIYDNGMFLKVEIYDLLQKNVWIHLEGAKRSEFIEKIAGLKRDE